MISRPTTSYLLAQHAQERAVDAFCVHHAHELNIVPNADVVRVDALRQRRDDLDVRWVPGARQ